MYNIFRKSIIILAGLGLLFLSSCSTIKTVETTEKQYTSFDTIFSNERSTLIYMNLLESRSLVDKLLKPLELNKNTRKLINSSQEIYLGFNKNYNLGFDAIINGEFSKKKAEFGLFLSFDWKKVKADGIKYWLNKEGMKLYFANEKTVIVSSFDIIPLIKNLNRNFIDPPTESIYIMLPIIEDDQVKKLSNGFIKGGIDSLVVTLDKNDNDYILVSSLILESPSKARGFSRLLSIFLKILLSSSQDADIVKIGQMLGIKSLEDKVIISNIYLRETFIADFINNLIFLEGEADK